jgi:hypothetical protein
MSAHERETESLDLLEKLPYNVPVCDALRGEVRRLRGIACAELGYKVEVAEGLFHG